MFCHFMVGEGIAPLTLTPPSRHKSLQHCYDANKSCLQLARLLQPKRLFQKTEICTDDGGRYTDTICRVAKLYRKLIST